MGDLAAPTPRKNISTPHSATCPSAPHRASTEHTLDRAGLDCQAQTEPCWPALCQQQSPKRCRLMPFTLVLPTHLVCPPCYLVVPAHGPAFPLEDTQCACAHHSPAPFIQSPRLCAPLCACHHDALSEVPIPVVSSPCPIGTLRPGTSPSGRPARSQSAGAR